MANLVLGFAEILIGAIVLDAGVKGAAISDVVKGQAVQAPITGSTGGSSASADPNPLQPSTEGPGYGTSSYGVAAPATPAAVAGNPTLGQVQFSDLKMVGQAMGWTTTEIAAWWALLPLESNGTITDTNSSSGAYGIAQFINGPSEYATYGGSATSVIGQLTAMANYIKERYGSPSQALTFHLANNWY